MTGSLQSIKNAYSSGLAMKSMAGVYSEMAVTRLGHIRSRIETNRQFALELAAIYHAVRAASKVPQVNKNAAPASPPLRRASVVLTSNQAFYRSLESRLMHFFLTVPDPGEIYLVGHSGAEMFYEAGLNKTYKAIYFSRDLPAGVDLTNLIQTLSQYDQVLVYHTRFQSIVSQKTVVTDISGEAEIVLTPGQIEETRKAIQYYILEPEAPKMLEIFKQTIARLLLEQAFLEAELARTASRLLTMDEAQSRAQRYINTQKILLARSFSGKLEKQILEMTLGYLARRKEK